MDRPSGPPRALLPADAPAAILIAAGALLVYMLTLAPGLYWGDSPELATAAYFAGVAHPTGYPLYTLLCHPWVRWGVIESPIWRMNFASAISAAAAAPILYLLLRRAGLERPACLLGALLAATATTFWSQAVIAEVYAFHLLAVSATMLAWVRWDQQGGRSSLLLACLLTGLSLTHHLMALLLLPAILYLVLSSNHRRQLMQHLPSALIAAALPLLLYIHLPVAAWRDTPANWGDNRSLANLLEHLTGSQYRSRMFAGFPGSLGRSLEHYAALPVAADRGLLFQQYWGPVYLLAGIGLFALIRQRRRFALFTLLAAGLNLFYALNYQIEDIEVYYILTNAMVALWAAAGADFLVQLLRTGAGAQRPALIAALLLPAVALVNLSRNWATVDRSGDHGADAMARANLAYLEPDALIMGGYDNSYFPLLYLHHVEKMRRDITLMQVFDLALPQRARLTARFSRPGLDLAPPPGFTSLPRRPAQDNPYLRSLLERHAGSRPIYLLGVSEELLALPWLGGAVDGYYLYNPTNLPLLKLLRRPPDLRLPASAAAERGLEFRTPAGRPVARLIGWRAAAEMKQGRPFWRIDFHWKLLDRRIASRLQVRPVFADENGNYRQEPDGTSELQAFHTPGLLYGPTAPPPPENLAEPMEAYVPPDAWGRQLYLWIALADGPDFLPAGGLNFVRLGPLPLAAPPRP